MPYRFFPGIFALTVLLFSPAAESAPPRPRQELPVLTDADVARWKETVTTALEIALEVPGTEPGRDAVQLYLDAFMELVMANRVPNELYEQLGSEIGNLVSGYCRPADIPTHSEPCGTLVSIQLDVRHWNKTPNTTPMTREAIRAFALQEAESQFKIWRDVGENLCLAKNKHCTLMAPLLHSVAENFRIAHRAGRAMEVRHIFLDPQYGLNKTRTLTGIYCDGAKDLEESLLDFGKAAFWYELCAREEIKFWPMAAWGPLAHAITLRLLLDDVNAAKRDLTELEDALGFINRHITGRHALSIAEHALRNEDWAGAETWLEQKSALFSTTDDPEVQVLFHAYRARIATNKGRAERAFAEYEAVRRAWRNAPESAKNLGKHQGDLETLEKVLNAVGEAEFFFAERHRKQIENRSTIAQTGPYTQ